MKTLVRHAGVVRMAGYTHLRLLSHWYDSLQKVLDVFPHPLMRAVSHLLHFRIQLGFLVYERAAGRASAAFGWSRARHAKEREIVFQRRDARFASVADHSLDLGDFAIPLWAAA